MSNMLNITIYFDYLCPFAYRMSRLVTEMEQELDHLQVTWRHFSLEQINAKSVGKPAEWHIWEQSLDYESLWDKKHLRGLTAFLASHAASKQGPEVFARFRLELFRLRHEEQQNSADPDVIMQVARQVQLNMADFTMNWQADVARHRLRDDHLSGLEAGVFGVPTLIINDCEPTYLRLTDYPEPDERQTIFEQLVQVVTEQPTLQELKRVSAA